MDPVQWEIDPPELRAPVLIACFSGWNDAASAASTALDAVADSIETEVVARIDSGQFFDFQANRPTIKLSGGQVNEIEWPSNLILAGRARGVDRDLLLINGTEPSMRWDNFVAAVLDVAERCGISTMITFGALIADVAHTRPVPITGLATNEALIAELGFEDVSYEGPTGITGVLHLACKQRGMTAASLWAAVPHYAAAVPNPKAALALLNRLEDIAGIAIDVSELEDEAESFERQVSHAVAANPEIKEMVERLEEQQDEVADFSEEVPSGDAIARDFQRFLRQQNE